VRSYTPSSPPPLPPWRVLSLAQAINWPKGEKQDEKIRGNLTENPKPLKKYLAARQHCSYIYS